MYKPRVFTRKHRKGYFKDYNANKRDPVSNAFYHSKEWKRTSAKLRKHAFNTCGICGRSKDGSSQLVVDHIIPLKIEPKLKLSEDNLWVLCKECHYWKTKLEQKIYGNSRVTNLDVSKVWSKEKIKKIILKKEEGPRPYRR